MKRFQVPVTLLDGRQAVVTTLTLRERMEAEYNSEVVPSPMGFDDDSWLMAARVCRATTIEGEQLGLEAYLEMDEDDAILLSRATREVAEQRASFRDEDRAAADRDGAGGEDAGLEPGRTAGDP